MYSNKHIIPIITVLLLLIYPVQSQTGFKGGIAISDIVFLVEGQTPYLGYEINGLTHRLPYLTYQFGLFKQFKLNNRLDFQPELLFIKKGLNYGMDFIYDDITYVINMHYLEVPLLLKYNFLLGKENKFALLVGPYASYMINNKRIREIDGKLEKDEMSNIRKTDFGIAASLSYDFNLKNNRLILDLRATYSLVNMMDYIEGYVLRYYGPHEERARNVTIALTMGYYFSSVEPK